MLKTQQSFSDCYVCLHMVFDGLCCLVCSFLECLRSPKCSLAVEMPMRRPVTLLYQSGSGFGGSYINPQTSEQPFAGCYESVHMILLYRNAVST